MICGLGRVGADSHCATVPRACMEQSRETTGSNSSATLAAGKLRPTDEASTTTQPSVLCHQHVGSLDGTSLDFGNQPVFRFTSSSHDFPIPQETPSSNNSTP